MQLRDVFRKSASHLVFSRRRAWGQCDLLAFGKLDAEIGITTHAESTFAVLIILIGPVWICARIMLLKKNGKTSRVFLHISRFCSNNICMPTRVPSCWKQKKTLEIGRSSTKIEQTGYVMLWDYGTRIWKMAQKRMVIPQDNKSI